MVETAPVMGIIYFNRHSPTLVSVVIRMERALPLTRVINRATEVVINHLRAKNLQATQVIRSNHSSNHSSGKQRKMVLVIANRTVIRMLAMGILSLFSRAAAQEITTQIGTNHIFFSKMWWILEVCFRVATSLFTVKMQYSMITHILGAPHLR